MPQFSIDSVHQIKSYLQSLDVFNNFEEIQILTKSNIVEIKVINNSETVYEEILSVSDLKEHLLFLDDKFADKIKSLSAVLEVEERLKSLKDLKASKILFELDRVALYTSAGSNSYEIRVFVVNEEFKIFVRTTFFDRKDEVYSERMYCTQGILIDLSRLEEIILKFDELDKSKSIK